MKIVMMAAAGACALCLGGLVCIAAGRHPPEKRLGKLREFEGMLRGRSRNLGWYRKKGAWLRKNGAAYHFGKKTDPLRLLVVKAGLALAGILGGSLLAGILGPGKSAGPAAELVAGICLGGLCFFLPELVLPYLNRRDNEAMLPDLRTIYHALSMQIRAGVYVTDALAECYGSVEQPRLRQALLELAGDLVMKADLFEALDHFQQNFENRYIDSLCITIMQATESGQAVELLGDISDQVRDMEEAVLAKRKGRLDRSLTFYQLGMLSAVLLVTLYACISYMLSCAIFG